MSKDEARRVLADLFTVGKEIQPDGGGPVLWVQKLNDWEFGETRRDAMSARSLVVMTFRRSNEALAIREEMSERISKKDLDTVLDGVISVAQSRLSTQAIINVQSDPKWTERLDVLQRTDRETADEEQRTTLDEINAEYMAEIMKRTAELTEAERERLEGLPDEELLDAYLDALVDSRATSIFHDEMRYGEILAAVRYCEAAEHTTDEMAAGGQWDHAVCTHERLYGSLEEIRALPDELLTFYMQAVNQVTVPASQAKEWASRSSSSEPSRQPNEAEESPASIQEETTREPVGTSA